MKKNQFIAIFLLIIFLFNNSFGISNEIRVIIGREIITEQDVINRINMVSFLSHIEITQILKEKKIVNDIVTTLINERLILKQMRKNNITVDSKAIQGRLNALLKKSHIDDVSFKNALNHGDLNLETLRNFIINEISFKEFVGRKIYPKLRASKYNKELFIEKLYQKFQKSSGVYKIFQFSKSYDQSVIDSINAKSIMECSQIEKIAKDLNLQRIFISNFKIDALNPGLREVILSKESDKGIFAYKDEDDMNVIGFCQIESRKIDHIDQKKIDLIYIDHLVSSEIKENYKFLRDNNFVLMKN